MEENTIWPPELVIPDYILQPILHTVYTIKAINIDDYNEVNEDEDFYYFMYQAPSRIKKVRQVVGVEQALDMLIETSKKDEGRLTLGRAKILPVVVQLARFLVSEKLPTHYPVYLSLKLLRNLCGGEILNQNLFMEVDGVEVVAMAVGSVKAKKNYGLKVVQTVLELLGNFCRAGEEHKNVVWYRFFPGVFNNIVRIGERDVLNILCMVVFACCDGSYGVMGQLHGVQGVQLVAEMVSTSERAKGTYEDWLLELLDIICLKGSYFAPLFKELKKQFDVSLDNAVSSSKTLDELKRSDIKLAHIFLFNLLKVKLDSKRKRSESNVSKEFALSILKIFRAAGDDFFLQKKSGLVSLNPLDVRLSQKYLNAVHLLKGSFDILKAFYSQDSKVTCPPGRSSSTAAEEDSVFELLLSSGLINHLLSFLHQLGSPSEIKRLEVVPYIGFDKEIVEFIGNCLTGRKCVQDEIRQKGAIHLLLQQCDEDYPFLRPSGLKTVAHLLDENRENQQALMDLKKDPSVYVPKLAGTGCGVKIYRETLRAEFVVREML